MPLFCLGRQSLHGSGCEHARTMLCRVCLCRTIAWQENRFSNSFSNLYQVEFTSMSSLLKFLNSLAMNYNSFLNLLIYYILSKAWIQVEVRVQSLRKMHRKKEKSGVFEMHFSHFSHFWNACFSHFFKCIFHMFFHTFHIFRKNLKMWKNIWRMHLEKMF